MLLTIEDTREELYEVLKSLGPGYHDRAELAARIGKKMLNPLDIGALDLLVSDGRIEKVSQAAVHKGRGGNFTKWVYRVIR